jgi:hypothetical protein
MMWKPLERNEDSKKWQTPKYFYTRLSEVFVQKKLKYVWRLKEDKISFNNVSLYRIFSVSTSYP